MPRRRGLPDTARRRCRWWLPSRRLPVDGRHAPRPEKNSSDPPSAIIGARCLAGRGRSRDRAPGLRTAAVRRLIAAGRAELRRGAPSCGTAMPHGSLRRRAGRPRALRAVAQQRRPVRASMRPGPVFAESTGADAAPAVGRRRTTWLPTASVVRSSGGRSHLRGSRVAPCELSSHVAGHVHAASAHVGDEPRGERVGCGGGDRHELPGPVW